MDAPEIASNDRIELRRLQIDTVIGVYSGNAASVSGSSRSRSAHGRRRRTRRLAKTDDYDAVSRHVRTFAAAARHELIETFADTLARDLLQSFALPWIELVIAKPGAVADCADVRLCIRREA